MKVPVSPIKQSIALAAALLAAGCAAPLPALPAPDTRPAASWHAPLPHGGSVADLRQWWERFDDPLLPALIDAAQDASPTLAQAGANLADARAARVAGDAALLPSLDLAASASRERPEAAAPVAQVSSLGLQAAWELDLFGANRAGGDAAAARLEGARALWHEARVSVAAETARLYVDLRACEAHLVEAGIDARSRSETARLTDAAAAAGVQAPSAAQLARASAADGQVALLRQQAQCELLVKALVALAAQDEAALRRRLEAATARLPEPAAIEVRTVPALALAQRPDLHAAARDVEAAAFDAAQAQARRWPRVTLAGSIGALRSSSLGASSEGGTWSVGPVAVTFPLFDGGVRRADAAAARERYRAATVVYAGRLRTAVQEVEGAMVTLDSSARRGAGAVAAVDGYRRAYAATLASYQAGASSLFDLEDARRSLRAANSALVDQRSERLQAWIALYRALGGGWSPTDAIASLASPSDVPTDPRNP